MTESIQAHVENRIGFITLNRPRALNALTPEMIAALARTLSAWRDDASVQAVFMHGAGDKGFCAGGDIRRFHEMALANDPALLDFFASEYRLDYQVATYPKPCVVLADGVAMGGGLGVSQPGAVRIVSETTRMAMPETQIGLFPDVGGGYFLSRLPGRLGEYLAVTGAVLNAADALYAGLARIFLPRSAHAALFELLRQGDWRDGAALVPAIEQLAARQPRTDADVSALRAVRSAVDRIFALPDVPSMLAALEREAQTQEAQDDDETRTWAAQIRDMMRQRSPLMMCVALEQIRRERMLPLADALRAELGMMQRVFEGGQAVEGIRALVIDKDRAPRWQPAAVAEVTPAQVARFFESPWPVVEHPLADLDHRDRG